MNIKICIAVVVMFAVMVAGGQVASHAPTLAGSIAPPQRAEHQYTPAKPVARVNGTVLTEQDLAREMIALFPYARQHGGIPKKLEPEVRRGALEMIIFEELLYQEARRCKVTVPEAKVTAAAAKFKKQFPSTSEYKRYLDFETHGSEPALRKKIRRSLIIDKMMETEVRLKAIPTTAEIRAYYERNAKEFTHGDIIHLQSISIIPPRGANADVLKEVWRRTEEAYTKAKDAKNYEQFGLLAESLSDDDFRVNYGDHKERPASEFPPEIVNAARGMKPGQISTVIQIGGARTIFRLIKFTPAGKTPFAEVKTKLAADLQKQKTAQIQSALGARLRKSAKIERVS